MMTAGQKGAGDAAADDKKTGRTKERYLDVVKEDIQNVGAREDEAFDQSESAMASPDGKAQTRRRKKHELYFVAQF